MLTSKQRSQLRGIAAEQDTILQIGKLGITDMVVQQTSEALAARELIKGRVLDNTLLSAREAGEELAEKCDAEVVHIIGSRFVLFKQNKKSPKIELIKDKKHRL